jgi:hypothetical protein
MKGRIALLAIVSLGACTSVSGIRPTEDGHLAVTCFARWDLVSWNHVRRTGVKQAQAYCSKYHKEMHEVTLHSQGLRGVTRQSVEVVFDCL